MCIARMTLDPALHLTLGPKLTSRITNVDQVWDEVCDPSLPVPLHDTIRRNLSVGLLRRSPHR
jgi:hypothetical protein